MEQQPEQAPPRVLSVPQTPVPQTCFGVLNDKGIPMDLGSIQDFPPEFSWMTGMEIYLDSFRFPRQTKPDADSRELWRSTVLDYNIGQEYSANGLNMFKSLKTWHYIPFTTSKWWTGTVKYRFMALKPPRVTGKILIRWIPDSTVKDFKTSPVFSTDSLRRSVKKEWDLGQSSECEFEISGFNVEQMRPTWVPKFGWTDQVEKWTSPPNLLKFCSWNLPPPSFNLGAIMIEEAQDLQPGSIS